MISISNDVFGLICFKNKESQKKYLLKYFIPENPLKIGFYILELSKQQGNGERQRHGRQQGKGKQQGYESQLQNRWALSC